MRRGVLVGLGFFSVVVLLGFLGYRRATDSQNQLERPVLELEGNFFDFGKVRYGRVLKQKVKIRNKGRGILKIERVATSCGCTSAEVDQTRLQPGESGWVRIVFDTKAMGETMGKGRQERFVYLKTNDPLRPQATIKIVAEVE